MGSGNGVRCAVQATCAAVRLAAAGALFCISQQTGAGPRHIFPFAATDSFLAAMDALNDLTADDSLDAQVLLCEACGRNFARMNAYSNHVGSCRRQKKRMASALGSAQEKYRNKKARLETSARPHPDEVGLQPTTAAALDVRNSNFLPLFFRVIIPHCIDRAHP